MKTNTDGWLFLLKNTCDLKTRPSEITREIFKSFLEEAKVEYLTPEEMETYTKSLRNSYQIMGMENCAEKRGEKRGRIEERLLIASNLLQRNMPIDDIISLTGLTREQIQELKV